MNEWIISKLKNYKTLKADIVNIDLAIEELEEEIGITAMPSSERTSCTNKVTSQVEIQAIEHMSKTDNLKRIRRAKEREIIRIDNALTVLSDVEKDIITILHIDNRSYSTAAYKVDRSYRRIKQLEKEALKKIEKYF